MQTFLRKPRRSNRRGTTAVEFALTAPIVFLLLMGAIEFSRANMLRHTAVVAATEGARRSIIPGATAEECQLAATRELAAVGFPSAEVLVDPPIILTDTTQVTVSISVPLSGDNGFVIPRFFKGAKIEKSVTLQRESAIETPGTEKVKNNGKSKSKNKSKSKGNNGSGNKRNGKGNGLEPIQEPPLKRPATEEVGMTKRAVKWEIAVMTFDRPLEMAAKPRLSGLA